MAGARGKLHGFMDRQVSLCSVVTIASMAEEFESILEVPEDEGGEAGKQERVEQTQVGAGAAAQRPAAGLQRRMDRPGTDGLRIGYLQLDFRRIKPAACSRLPSCRTTAPTTRSQISCSKACTTSCSKSCRCGALQPPAA